MAPLYVPSGTSPRDSFHQHVPPMHRRKLRGAGRDTGTPKATSPLPGAERMNGWEGRWSGGPVKEVTTTHALSSLTLVSWKKFYCY